MEFDYSLTKVQGNLMSAQRLLGIKLADIGPENQEEIGSLVKSFSTLIKDLNCNIDSLRKINLFLIINTDLYSSPLVEKDINYCHLVRAVPQISRFLYFELLVNTNLYKTAGDVVLFCPEVLAVDVLQVITRYLYRCDSTMFLNFFSSLIESLYLKIIKLECDSKPGEMLQTFTKLMQKIVDFPLTNLKCNEGKSKLEKQCYFGHFYKAYLNLIENFVKYYELKETKPSLNMYNIKFDYNYGEWGPTAPQRDWPLFNLNNIIFRCKTLALDVTVDTYMAWVEQDLDDSNLQMKVREAAYTCQEALEAFGKKSSLSSLPQLIKSLSSMAVKPRGVDDEIASADLDIMVEKIGYSDGPQSKWLNALLSTEGALTELSVLNKIATVTDVFDTHSLMNFIKIAVKEIEEGSANSDQLKAIIFKTMKHFSVKEQLIILDSFYQEFGCSSILRTSSFQSNLTEAFNKIVLESEKMEELLPEIIILVLQSMKEVIPHILNECLRSQMRCDLLTSLLKEIYILMKVPAIDDKCQPLLYSLLIKKFEEILQICPEDRINFLHMMEKFCHFGVIDSEDFLFKQLIPAIQLFVSKKKWPEVDLCLDIFSIYVDGRGGEGLEGKIAEIIIFLSQALDRARQQPPAFSRASASVCEKTASFVYKLTALFVNCKNTTDAEVEWVRKMGICCSPLSRFHMRKLWKDDLPDDNQLVWATQNLGIKDWDALSPNDRATLVTSLCKVLPLLSGSEWRMIGFELSGAKRAAQCASVFHAVADAVLVLAQLPVLLTNPVCLGFILSNFIGFVKTKVAVNMKHMTRSDCATIVGKLCVICSELPEPVVRSRSAALIPLVREALANTVSKTESGGCSDLVTAVSSVTEPTLRAALASAVVSELA